MSKHWVFGYGSLPNRESVQETVPEIQQLQPCFVKGFVRDFSFWSPTGYVVTNLDVAGEPFYALNAIASASIKDIVNGVCFEVDDKQLEKLAVREHGYNLLQTVTYDFKTGEPLHDCILYSAVPHRQHIFEADSPAQKRYLKTCLTGAQSHGNMFYDQFLQTTFISTQSLADVVRNYPPINSAAITIET